MSENASEGQATSPDFREEAEKYAQVKNEGENVFGMVRYSAEHPGLLADCRTKIEAYQAGAQAGYVKGLRDAESKQASCCWEIEKDRDQLKQQLSEYEKSGACQFLNQQILELREQRAAQDAEIERLNEYTIKGYELLLTELKSRLRDAERVMHIIAHCMTGTPQLDCVDYFAKHAGKGGGL